MRLALPALLIASLGIGSCCTSRPNEGASIPVDNGAKRRERIEETKRETSPPETQRQQSAEEPVLPVWGSNEAEQIKADVLFALNLEPRLADNLIDAEYDRGFVRLIGTVDSESEQSKAAQLAGNVPGVEQVILDELQIAQ